MTDEIVIPERPPGEEYEILNRALTEARARRVQLDIFAAYEQTEVPGFEPKTLDELYFGPRTPKRAKTHPYGRVLEEQIAATDAQIALLEPLFSDWEAREQAWADARAAEAERKEAEKKAAEEAA